MARYDVYKLQDGPGYVLDVQADILAALSTRIVVPLLPVETAPKPARGLNPVFRIEEADYVLATQFLASVPKDLVRVPVTNLNVYDATIMKALDMALTGF